MVTQVITFASAYWLLFVIIVSLSLLLVSVWFHAVHRVPFVPTPNRVVDAMLKAADIKEGDTVIDLGAGDGRFLIRAKRAYPSIHALGYEGSLGVWLLGKLRIHSAGLPVEFLLSDFKKADLSKADVLFVYLSIDTMKQLLPKFARELKPGVRIISHAFRFPGFKAVTIPVQMQIGGSTKIHKYITPMMAE
jgi:ubiquinone/menaquinone biosynthesis C-methylase UbiE